MFPGQSTRTFKGSPPAVSLSPAWSRPEMGPEQTTQGGGALVSGPRRAPRRLWISVYRATPLSPSPVWIPAPAPASGVIVGKCPDLVCPPCTPVRPQRLSCRAVCAGPPHPSPVSLTSQSSWALSALQPGSHGEPAFSRAPARLHFASPEQGRYGIWLE